MASRVLWLLLACAALYSLGAAAQRTTPLDTTTDRLIIKWKQNTAADAQIRAADDHRISRAQLDRLAAHAGVDLAPHRGMSGNAQVVRLSGRRSVAAARAIAARLASHPDIEFAVPDLKRFPAMAPNDPYFVGKLQSNLTALNLPLAWDVTQGDPNLVVAVLDTGILPQHPDLIGRTLPGYDFVTEVYAANDGAGRDASAVDPGDWVSFADVNDPNSPFDSACLYAGLYENYSSWHGTHIAGIIGATGNNNLGVAGINWNSKLLPVRVLGKCGGYDSDIIDGMRWAAGLAVPNAPTNTTPAKVLNMSLGGFGACNPAWQSGIDDVVGAGKIVVVAAGNEGDSFKSFTPASCQGVIAVAAHNYQNGQSFYSNYGTAADTNLFAAPGDNVYSTSNDGLQQATNDYDYFNEYGTSSAAAHISGVISLVLSRNPTLTPANVLQLLRDASVPLGDWAGSGRPDAFAAVGNALVYGGPAKTPVSMVVNGPDTVFEEGTANYTATVTWSDASTSQVYPKWSVSPLSQPPGSFNIAGTFRAVVVNTDQVGTVGASFTWNGVTVTGSKQVTILDNYVTAIEISGPSTVNIANSAPSIYSAKFTYRSGLVQVAIGGGAVGSDWGMIAGSGSGSISSAGIFTPVATGSVTITQALGAVTANYPVTIVNTAPTSASFAWSCLYEDVSALTLDQMNYLSVGSSASIVPLCDGKVLVADQVGHRVDVVDARAGNIVKSWSFSGKPYRLELAPGTSKVFVTFLNSGEVSRLDLATGENLSLAPVTGTAAFLENGESGEMWVLHWPTGVYYATAALSIYDVASGALLRTRSLTHPATSMLYSRARHILITLDATQRTSYTYAPVAQTFTEREYADDAGGNPLTAISPDGTRILQGGKDLDTQALTFSRGIFTGVGTQGGDFSANGKLLVANRANSSDNDLVLFDVATHVELKTWLKPDNCPYWGYQQTRFSPTGAYVYGYEQCGSSGEYGRLFWVATTGGPSPDPIAFEGQAGVAPGVTAASNTVTLGGFTGTASVKVTGGEYSIGGGSFTASPGTVMVGQTIAVRTQASGQSYATTSAVLTVGNTKATFFVTTGTPLPAQWWNPTTCGAEQDLGNTSVAFADIDPAWDMIALCDGRLLIGNRRLNRIELFDVRAKSAVKTWQLSSTPQGLRLVPGTSTLLVVMASSSIANVDLASGAVGEIAVGGRLFDVTPAEPGKMISVGQGIPGNNTLEGDTLYVHDIATGAQLSKQYHPGGGTATIVRYDPVANVLYSGDGTHTPSRLVRYASGSFGDQEYVSEMNSVGFGYGADVVLSPDSAHVLYVGAAWGGGVPNVLDLDTHNLHQPRGTFYAGPFPATADFRADSAKLLIGNAVSSVFSNGVGLFDTASRALEKHWLLPHCDTLQGKARSVRFSPTGSYVYALETCGSFNGDSARLFWIPAAAASTMPVLNPVAFISNPGAPLSSEINSNEVTITGLGGLQLPISVENGTFSINGGQFLPFNTLIRDGDRVRVQNISWFTTGVTTTTTLNVGGALIPFNVTTGASGNDTTPNAFGLYVLKRQALATEFTSNTIVVNGIDAPAPISVSGGSYSVDGGAFTSQAGMVTNGQSVAVRLTSASAPNTQQSALLTIGGTSAAFSVTTLSVPTPPTITSANAATFAVGVSGTFTVTAAGLPIPTFSVQGALPSGVNFTNGVLAGMPGAGTAGTYPLTITATNALPPDATQNFTLTVVPPQVLTVSKVGSGTIGSNPAGIACGATCSSSFVSGIQVTLTATPATGYGFGGWSGACSGSGVCIVTMDTAKDVTATFTDTQAPLAPGGTTATPVSSSEIKFAWIAATDNVGVTQYNVYRGGVFLTAVNGSTTSINNSGLGASTLYSYTVAACDAAGNCSAQSGAAVATTPAPPTYALSVATAGGGTVTSSPSGINCGATCSSTYSQGTAVTLTPTPTSNLNFAGWSGACTGNGACTVTMDAAKSVTATFGDTQAPSVPAGLAANAVSSSQINVTWTASTDNVGVIAYQLYRGGVFRTTVNAPTLNFNDSGLTASSAYSYKVAACDAAGNCSAQSAQASATTLAPGQVAHSPKLEAGFNLGSNALNITLDVAALFGNQDSPVAGVTSNIVSVWKWNAALARWGFYSPQLSAAANTAYASTHNFDALSAVNPGEGYWMNATGPITLPAQVGSTFTWSNGNFSSLPTGFNLIAAASNITPSEFNNNINATPPAPGVVPTDNFVSLWVWDAVLGKWYFYSPLLEASGGLPAVKAYADSHNYLHFQDFNKQLGIGTGFWVNKP